MQRFYLVALAVVFAGWTSMGMQPQPDCTITLKPEDSIRKAIEEVAPGAVICLEEGIWDDGFLIQKDITIRGAGPDRTIIRAIAMAWTELPIIVVIQGLSVGGVVIQGPIRVTLQDSHVQANGMYVIGNATVDLLRATISASGFGLILFGQVTVTIVDSQVVGAKLAGILILSGAARINLINSRVINNGIGIDTGIGEDPLYLSLEQSVISNNGREGLVANHSAKVEIRESNIESNGADVQLCAFAICPGIQVSDQAEIVIKNSRIANNWDWAVAARLRKCGYERDEFNGKVIFEGENTIIGNNRSGRFTGEVCLP